MNDVKKSDLQLREAILKLLSPDEVAKVSTAETDPMLTEGEEYLDLEQLGRGVRRADGVKVQMARVLPKRSVHADTWEKIRALLPKA